MKQPRVTMQMLADRLGVSKYTVSQALSGKTGVSEATRKLVLETAKSMGYRKPPEPISAGEGRSATDGDVFLVVWIPLHQRGETSFWQRVLAGITHVCEERSWKQVILSPFEERGRTVVFPPYLDASRCIGGLAIGSFALTTVTAMTQTGLHVVLVDHDEPFASLDSVVNNNVEAAHGLVARMVETGCRRILFVGSDRFAISFRERWWGCRMAAEELASNGHTLTLRKWSFSYTDRRWTAQLAEKLDALAAGDWPDGIIGANDHMAIEVLNELARRSVAVPGKCRVAGFDNVRQAAEASPPLTTVDLGKEELGRRAVEALQLRLACPDRPRERIALSPRLIVRSSC